MVIWSLGGRFKNWNGFFGLVFLIMVVVIELLGVLEMVNLCIFFNMLLFKLCFVLEV